MGWAEEFTFSTSSQVMLLTGHTLRITGIEILDLKQCFVEQTAKSIEIIINIYQRLQCWPLELEALGFPECGRPEAKANNALISRSVVLVRITHIPLSLTPPERGEKVEKKASFE